MHVPYDRRGFPASPSVPEVPRWVNSGLGWVQSPVEQDGRNYTPASLTGPEVYGTDGNAVLRSLGRWRVSADQPVQ